MIDNLIYYFEQHINLDEIEKRFIKENIPINAIKKNHLLLAEGETSKEFYFVLKGSVRLYYNTDSEEKTALVKEMIVKKATILRNGYLKHQNMDHLKYVESIIHFHSDS